ncbi:toxin-antitoxin antitoxin component [Pseudomonas syringae pv. actinidifoliorum]|uniref:type VII toxin-antitoxin system HepT family RNase toxin n=1 Tax=Pseudomonas syringae TaxID=317 RepID=UPI0013726E54|nr:DUF86 domain-containing protein [Pseudomonas syringae]NAT00032.1 toxin-antitoxin antitoxin component [Pseudomonas syringae pv. actinidifoliorum]NAT63128.1 toxin-antitoxin antitoxin component [Pseudomonas syringae pv. actinidifoliorum]
MVDDVLVNKAASIERCVARVREEYEKDPATFEFDFTRQDAAIFNIQRACEAALDMGQHLIRREGLGVPQSARDVFDLLHRGGWLAPSLLPVMKNMVGFKNIAVHDYQTLQLPITVAIITQHLGDFILFSSAILRRDVASPNG